LNGGTLTGIGTVTVTNALNWISGTMSGTGHTAASGAFTLNGSFLTLNARTIGDAGTASLAQGTSISTSNNAVWNNLAGGTLDSQGDASFSSFAAGPQLNNAGLLRKSAGTGSTTIGMALNNTGTVQVSSGTLNLSGGGSNSGSFTIGAGDTVNFSGSIYILQAGSTFSGAGTVQIATFSTVNVAGDASMQVLVLAGGAVTGHGTLTVNGLLTWSGGTMSGSGQTTANGGAAITRFVTLDTRIFNNFA